jgi:hypothetical protein
MVQVLKRPELEAQEEIIIIIPEIVEVKDKRVKQKPAKKLRSSRKTKKTICIDKVKKTIDAGVYRSGYFFTR